MSVFCTSINKRLWSIEHITLNLFHDFLLWTEDCSDEQWLKQSKNWSMRRTVEDPKFDKYYMRAVRAVPEEMW